MRVVLDVNVLVAALLSRSGTPGRLITLWVEGAFELVISQQLLAELGRALAYPKLREYISTEDGAQFIALLRATASMVADAEPPGRISRDPGDEYLLALATASASILVTGDRDLLVLAPDLPIQDPAAFLEHLEG